MVLVVLQDGSPRRAKVVNNLPTAENRIQVRFLHAHPHTHTHFIRERRCRRWWWWRWPSLCYYIRVPMLTLCVYVCTLFALCLPFDVLIVRKLQVFCLDSGLTRYASLDNIFHWSPLCCTIPFQAILCNVVNVRSRRRNDAEAIEFMSETLLHRPVLAEVKWVSFPFFLWVFVCECFRSLCSSSYRTTVSRRHQLVHGHRTIYAVGADDENLFRYYLSNRFFFLRRALNAHGLMIRMLHDDGYDIADELLARNLATRRPIDHSGNGKTKPLNSPKMQSLSHWNRLRFHHNINGESK